MKAASIARQVRMIMAVVLVVVGNMVII